MFAIRIKMKENCQMSRNLLEIDSIYLTGLQNEGYCKKEVIHDYLKNGGEDIFVNIRPYPKLQPAVSINGGKYVRSIANGYGFDNLLNLPRD